MLGGAVANTERSTYIDRTRAAVVRSVVLWTSFTASFRRVEPSFERQLHTEPQFPKPMFEANAFSNVGGTCRSIQTSWGAC